jgi:hypothetical protein
MSNTIYQKFKSDANKNMVIKIVDDVVRSKFQINLNEEFSRIFNDIMEYVHSRFGKKAQNLTDDEHLKNINKICIDESIKYISDNINFFPKIHNTHANNRVQVISESQALVPVQQQPENLFRGTDDLLQQMQYDRGNFTMSNGNGSSQGGGGGADPYSRPQQSMGADPYNRQQANFSLPLEVPGQKTSEQLLAEAMESRRNEFPSMVTPQYKIPGSEQAQQQPQQAQLGNASLMGMLLQTPFAIQNPTLVPAIANEIMQMQHLIDIMNKNPQGFQQQIRNPDFLQMIINQIKNKNNPKLKPMNLSDDPMAQAQAQAQAQANGTVPGDISSELMKRIDSYTNGSEPSMATGLNFENQLTKYIPPSEQLINNTLPNLDQVHLIDYTLSLDFRNDLDNTTKNRHTLRFHKYGNISKIKMLTCLIPENDYLASEPYIYIKIDELGGRCYTSNHDTVFGKLVLSENRGGYLYYKADDETCFQTFSQPRVFDKFTVSFLNYNGQYLNLKEIAITKTLKLKKQNKLKFITQYRHKLIEGEEIEIHIYRKTEIDSYNVHVSAVIDDHTFTVDNSFDVLTDKIKVLKNSINCCLSFKFYEINWNLLTNKNAQNAQLIRLAQLVSETKKDLPEYLADREIVESVKSQLTPRISEPIQTPGNYMMVPFDASKGVYQGSH